MEFRRNFLAVALIFWFFFFSPIASDPLSFSEAISGLKETVAQALKTGVGEEWEITRFDPRDASVIQSLVYEFHIQIGKTVFPIRLLEDLNNSSNIFWDDEDNELAPESGILDIIQKSRRVSPVLSPFQLAGPLELWIQDGDNLRLALPVSNSSPPSFLLLLLHITIDRLSESLLVTERRRCRCAEKSGVSRWSNSDSERSKIR